MVSSVLEVEAGVAGDESRNGEQAEARGEQRGGTAAEGLRELFAKVPPSARDFDVYEHVVVEGGHTRSAAHEHKISQTRVCQVLSRVRRWIREVLGAEAREFTPEQQLALAVAVAADRLDCLYRASMCGWNASTEFEVEKVTTLANGRQITTETSGFGEPRYLIAAGRLALMRAKLPTGGVLTEGLATAAGPDEPLPEEETTDAPPEVDCSDPEEFRQEMLKAVAGARDGSRDVRGSCDPLNEEAKAARRAFFGPVQELEMSDLAQSALRSKGGPNAAKAARAMA